MEFTAKTVEEAIASGLAELGVTEAEAEITVVEQPVKGLFGKLKGKAVVDITVKSKSGTERAEEFVQKILDLMDITAKTKLDVTGENPVINLVAEDGAAVIGYKGEVLDAIQTLAGAIANIGSDKYKKVVVDCENYRERRNETLVKLAHKYEEKATEMRREVHLDPMSPFERRIIHTALADSKTVTTKSDGKEPNRFVVIVPNDKDEDARPYIAGRKPEGKFGKGKFERRFDGKGRKGGFGKDRRSKSGSGFTEQRKKTSFGFGTYLGNSLKDDN